MLKTRSPRRAFTVLDSIATNACLIALLALVLPALASSRNSAGSQQSISNLITIGAAHAMYGIEYNDRQFTVADELLSSYGFTANEALNAYQDENAQEHPPMNLGWGPNETDDYLAMWYINVGAFPGLITPISFVDHGLGDFGIGSFRLPNLAAFNQYINGRFYDETFYAPNDGVVHELVEPYFDEPYGYTPTPGASIAWSSYCFSPAAFMDPQVLGYNKASDGYYHYPFALPFGLRVSRFSEVVYPDLKTQLIEHNWNQNTPADPCNPAFKPGTYDGCEPYYFNHSIDSAPVSLFYDGSVRLLPNAEVQAADQQILTQTKGARGLWSRDTPFGNEGYFGEFAFDAVVNVSHHILTIDGAHGRDTINGLSSLSTSPLDRSMPGGAR